jgi:Fe2+ transport system protein FeoA
MPRTTGPVAATIPLSRVAVGERRIVVRVDGPARDELECEGLVPGSVVVVRTRTPLGGPVIVGLGSTRIALSLDVAGRVSTSPATR